MALGLLCAQFSDILGTVVAIAVFAGLVLALGLITRDEVDALIRGAPGRLPEALGARLAQERASATPHDGVELSPIELARRHHRPPRAHHRRQPAQSVALRPQQGLRVPADCRTRRSSPR